MDRRTPSIRTLCATFRDLTTDDAKLIRKLCKAVDDRYVLQDLIEIYCQDTEDYANSLHSIPWHSAGWRRTLVLHALDRICETHGVETIGDAPDYNSPPPFEYLNTGDSYAATLVYSHASDHLYVACWGDIAERHSH